MRQASIYRKVTVASVIFLFSQAIYAIDWVYEDGDAPTPTDGPNTPFISPQPASFKASGGDSIPVWIDLIDKDLKVSDDCRAEEVPFDNNEPWVVTWEISGNASFSSGSSVKTMTTTLQSPQHTIYIGSGFSGSDEVSITVTPVDHSSDAPGEDQDAANPLTITITARTKCPTSLACISPSPCSGEKNDPATYEYRCDPDIGSTGRPDYTSQSILEQFGSISSNLDKTVHITAQGLSQFPYLSNTGWINMLFSKGKNSIFTPDAADTFRDQNGGFSGQMDFIKNPPSSELTWDLPQTFVCNSPNGNLSQGYTIRHILKTSGATKINKS